MKVLKNVVGFLTVWILLALIGYGVALKDYSEKWQVENKDENAQSLETQERVGRITWVSNRYPSKKLILFKLEGSDETLTISESYLQEEAIWKILDQFMRVGTKISVLSFPPKWEVVQLIINPGNVFQKNIFSKAQSAQTSRLNALTNIKLGFIYIVLGLLGFLILIFLFKRGLFK